MHSETLKKKYIYQFYLFNLHTKCDHGLNFSRNMELILLTQNIQLCLKDRRCF